ncbi:MAG: RNA polymerase sigma-70 factor [Mangrovibacterium sp.]|nr:RNA polymerase sigma-70 factor [Mangrovibacterium sp.]
MIVEEKLLIEEIQRGNQAVFESVFHQYYKVLVKFAEHFLLNRDASEDIVQAVFIYLWENSKGIKIEKSLRSYLYQSVKNRCLNYLRSLKIRDKYQMMYFEALLLLYDEDMRADSEMIVEIKKAFRELPEQASDIFRMKYFEEQSIREISNKLSISENTVKVQLFNARNRIRKILDYTVGCLLLF